MINGLLYYVIKTTSDESEVDEKDAEYLSDEDPTEFIDCSSQYGSEDYGNKSFMTFLKERTLNSLVTFAISFLSIPILHYLAFLFLQPDLSNDDLSCAFTCEHFKEPFFILTFLLEFLLTFLLEVYLLKQKHFLKAPRQTVVSLVRMVTLSMLFFFGWLIFC